MTTAQRQTSDTVSRILDAAEALVQTRGFNGFSYADIAGELKITTASLHYHFAAKADLGRTLIDRYSARFFEALAGIDLMPAAASKLRAYADIYAAVLAQERLCLCGMLAAEYTTLPQPMRNAILRFFDDNETWLTRVLEEGRETSELRYLGDPDEVARMIVGALEGAMLVARPYGDLARFQSAAERLIQGLDPKQS